jgi:hypothetical protein
VIGNNQNEISADWSSRAVHSDSSPCYSKDSQVANLVERNDSQVADLVEQQAKFIECQQTKLIECQNSLIMWQHGWV